MANIRDVAKKAGVSITTVSRILNNDPSFKTTEETRNLIFKAIKDLKYTPVTKNNKIHIGFILAETSEKYSDAFCTTILAACEEEAARRNMAITQVRDYSELCNPLMLQDFINGDLKGLITMERLPNDMLETIKKKIPSIVYIDYDEALEEINTVGFDHRFANINAFNYLISCGYRRIGLIVESSPIDPYEESIRLMTYREVLRRNNIKYDGALVKDCACDIDKCIEQTHELMSLENPPDVIFAASDTLASAVLSELTRLGFNCPKDVGVMGFNNNQISLHTVPSLTTTEIPMKDIGKIAIRRLCEVMSSKTNYNLKISLPTKLIVRESTRRVK